MIVREVMDRRFDNVEVPTLDMSDRERCEEWIASALDDHVDVVVVLGDDASLGALATAYFDTVRSEPLTFLTVAAGGMHTVADSLGSEPASRRGLARVRRKLERGELKPTSVSTIRIVDSLQTASRIGFAFGMGGVNELAAGNARVRRRDAVKQAFGPREFVNADVFVDWTRTSSRFGYLVASSLRRTWADIEMGAGTTLRMGDSPLDLVRGATRLGRAVERATGSRAVAFGRVHIDTNSDYVVDGVLRRCSKPRIVALTPGPQVRVLSAS